MTYQSKIQCQFNLLCFFCIFNSFRTLKKDSKEFKRKKSSSIKVWYFNIYKILDEKIRTEFKLPPLFIGIHLYTRTTNSLSRKFSNSNLTHILSWKKKEDESHSPDFYGSCAAGLNLALKLTSFSAPSARKYLWQIRLLFRTWQGRCGETK